jgi:lysophospholipase L1-like esterase
MGEEGFSYNKAWVSKIIELCLAHDIQPVLITTPITSVLNTVYAERSPKFFETFYRFTRELQEAYPSVPYFDYSHDPRFENNFSLFFDGDHLNTAGAGKFTAIVVSDLQSRGLLQ